MEPQSSVRARVTPKDFFLWIGSLTALYLSAFSFVFLLFNYIDRAFPNALAYVPNPYDGGMPFEMAALAVLVPVYVALTRTIHRFIARDSSRAEVWVRRWAVILTLFIAGVTVTIDAITLLAKFFRGEELTVAFLLKAFVVLIVAALAFWYFIYDLRGYWDAHRARGRILGTAFAAAGFLAIAAGFFIVGTPRDARLARLDGQRAADLQSLQYQIASYWQEKRVLPSSLSALADPFSGYLEPKDPESSAAYEYAATGERAFELCATFDRANAPVRAEDPWTHPAGRTCFVRSIDPDHYPPLPGKILR